MRRLFFVLAAAVGLIAVALAAQAEPDPITCDGYPEPRVFMENQTWVEPMPADPDNPHPGDGEQGHIHVSTCFPLNQTVMTDTIEFDIRLQLHNVPGDPVWFIGRPYLIGPNKILWPGNPNFPLPGGCDQIDCDTWFHFEYDLASLDKSGWTNFQLLYQIALEDGETRWYNINRWHLYVENGKPESTRTSQVRLERLGGDTWLEPGPGSSYSEAWINWQDYPWDPETGLVPLEGTWDLTVNFCCDHNNDYTTGFATLDPALHADPLDLGTVVYDGPAGTNIPLSIDTTTLEDGEHKLLLSACNPRVTEDLTQCGVLVIRFLVDNGPPPVVVDLEPGQSAVVNCPTTLTGTISEDQADLTCAP